MATIRLNVADLSAPVQQTARLPVSGLGLTQVPLEVGLSAGRGLMQAGSLAGDLATALDKAETDSQVNRGLNQAMARLPKLETEANGDLGAFQERSRALFSEIADGLSNPSARTAFLQRAQSEANGIGFRVERAGHARIAGEAASALVERLNGLATQGASGAAHDRAAALQGGLDAIARASEAGYLSPARAATLRQNFQAQVSEGAARRLMIEDPSAAAALLRDPAALPGLSPVQRYRLLDATIRRDRAAGGGLRVGGGPAPEDVPDLTPAARLELERDGERAAAAEDQREMQTAAFQERQGFAAWQDRALQATEQFFVGMSDLGGDAQDVPMRSVADLLPAQVADAARLVADTGGAAENDMGAMRELLFRAGTEEPETFARGAADEVTAGRITAGTFTQLLRANRDLMANSPAATAWRRARGTAAAIVDPPDMAELGVPSLSDAQAAALLEMDEWRQANPRATPRDADAATREIAQRHRQAMADRAIAALPRIPELGEGPYRPDALDGLEADVLDDFEQGNGGIAEVARLLRIIDAWRWAGEDMAPDPGPQPGRIAFKPGGMTPGQLPEMPPPAYQRDKFFELGADESGWRPMPNQAMDPEPSVVDWVSGRGGLRGRLR